MKKKGKNDMKTNLNCNCPKPQFGMAIHVGDNNVERVLKSGVKSLKDVEKINDIFKKQNQNSKIDIRLFANDKTGKLSANVYANDYSVNGFYRSYSENFFSRLFRGPVKFIEKLAKVANKEEAKILKKEEIANKLNI